LERLDEDLVCGELIGESSSKEARSLAALSSQPLVGDIERLSPRGVDGAECDFGESSSSCDSDVVAIDKEGSVPVKLLLFDKGPKGGGGLFDRGVRLS